MFGRIIIIIVNTVAYITGSQFDQKETQDKQHQEMRVYLEKLYQKEANLIQETKLKKIKKENEK